MAEEFEHAGDADVGLPGGHISKGVHILVDFEQRQCVQLGGFPKQLPFVVALIEEEPEVLLEVFILDGVLIEQEPVILAMQVVAEGDSHHAHLLQLVEALQMCHRALRIT